MGFMISMILCRRGLSLHITQTPRSWFSCKIGAVRMCCQRVLIPLSDLYITNLFVFVKPGGLSANIPIRHMTYSASKYGLAQIEVIRPKMVLCLGGATYNGVRRALGVRPVKIGAGLAMPPISYCEANIYGLSHTGGLGVKNAGGIGSLHDQWKTIGEIHNSL